MFSAEKSTLKPLYVGVADLTVRCSAPEIHADASGNTPRVLILQKPGACRKLTTAQVPWKVPASDDVLKLECDCPPMTGSFITRQL